jgi:hypothetical protein
MLHAHQSAELQLADELRAQLQSLSTEGDEIAEGVPFLSFDSQPAPKSLMLFLKQ